jgi:hypothetical protein
MDAKLQKVTVAAVDKRTRVLPACVVDGEQSGMAKLATLGTKSAFARAANADLRHVKKILPAPAALLQAGRTLLPLYDLAAAVQSGAMVEKGTLSERKVTE